MKRFTVLTRDAAGNQAWRAQLEQHGAQVYELPCIQTEAAAPTPEIVAAFDRIQDFSWIIFTTPTSVQFFMELAAELNLGLKSFTAAWIAAASHQTADVIKSLGLVVHFVPSRQDTATLARELKKVKSRHILFLRAGLTSSEPIDTLRRRSSKVTELHIYRTRPLVKPDPGFHQLLRDGEIARIIFASASAVQGFMQRLTDPVSYELALSIPAVAIGPTVASALRQAGFAEIRVLPQPSIRALISA